MPVMSGTHFSMDFIGPLPPSQWNENWYDSIFVYKDRFNGWIEAWPTSTNATGEDIADLYFTHKQTDQQRSQTKPSFKYYEIGYQRNKTTGHNTYHLSHTQSTYP